jgi:hypothetical protein
MRQQSLQRLTQAGAIRIGQAQQRFQSWRVDVGVHFLITKKRSKA